MAEKAKRKRIYFLDELRGFAILCMIVHHAFLDVGDVLGLTWGYRIFDALCTVQPAFGRYSLSFQAYVHAFREIQLSADL